VAAPLAVALLLPIRLAGQFVPPPDSVTLARAAARAAIVHWVESAGRASEQVIKLKNTSGQVVQLESYEIYECINIAPSRVCRVNEGGQLIRPGETIALVTLGRRYNRDAWRYRYRFEVRFVRDSSSTDSTTPQRPN
jgi:hypothetical protein